MNETPWLTFEEASAHLKAKFNVSRAPGTIENKVYAKEIESTVIAGERKIHRDRLDEWALQDTDNTP